MILSPIFTRGLEKMIKKAKVLGNLYHFFCLSFRSCFWGHFFLDAMILDHPIPLRAIICLSGGLGDQISANIFCIIILYLTFRNLLTYKLYEFSFFKYEKKFRTKVEKKDMKTITMWIYSYIYFSRFWEFN